MGDAFEEMQLGCKECHDSRYAEHDRCLCEDCMMQNFSYFGHQYDVLEKPPKHKSVLEKRPKRKSITSIDESFRGLFKESRLDNRTVTESFSSWCPAFGSWGASRTFPSMYGDILLRYDQGKWFIYVIS